MHFVVIGQVKQINLKIKIMNVFRRDVTEYVTFMWYTNSIHGEKWFFAGAFFPEVSQSNPPVRQNAQSTGQYFVQPREIHEKGKPSERVGRKARGLRLEKAMTARSPVFPFCLSIFFKISRKGE